MYEDYFNEKSKDVITIRGSWYEGITLFCVLKLIIR